MFTLHSALVFAACPPSPVQPLDPLGQCPSVTQVDREWRLTPAAEPPNDDRVRVGVGTGVFLGRVAGLVVGTASGAAVAEVGTSRCTGDCGDGGGGPVIVLGLGTLGTLIGGVIGGALTAGPGSRP